jgi:hypothetical protein
VLRERDEDLTRLYCCALPLLHCTRFVNIKKASRGCLRCFCAAEAVRSAELVSWERVVVSRSIRVAGKLLWLGLLSGALALPLVALAPPLGAEEVTVTIPPDDPPAQEQPAQQGFDPTAHPTDDAPMPNSSAQAEPAPEEPAPAEQAPEAAPPTPPAAAEATPATPPVVKKAHKKVKKAAASEAPADGTAEAPAAAKPAKKKTASAKASCLNLTEEKCGSNTACVWVAAGTNDAGKATTARCRSLAILKRETDKAAKAANKTKGPEVLPWAANGGATTASTSTATPAEAKPAKKKTVSAKKAKPKPAEAEAPPVVPSSSDASGAD